MAAQTNEIFAHPQADHAFYAMDVYRARAIPQQVYAPRTKEELQAIVRKAAAEGLHIITRGGGVSYTDGYLPISTNSISIDTGGLNRIISIQTQDMLVTVEPGISWKELDEKLKPLGVKVPFMGTFSGLAASVGGTVSQNANGMGSNSGGISPESVVAIELLNAHGEFITVGGAGSAGKSSKFRWNGPDLVGIFTGDCGSLGIKTAITLRLIRRREFFEAASFAFPSFDKLHATMARLAGEKIDEKSFGLDLALSQGQIAKQDTGSMFNIAAAVWKSSPNIPTAISSLARMAMAGKRVLASAPYAAHYIVEGHDPIEARAKITTLRRIASESGREIANSVPVVVRSIPFQPLHNMLGPKGERWVPLHGLFPHSHVADFHAAITSYVESRRADMERHGVHCGAMFSCIGTTTFLYEPALYWQDELTEFHRRMMEPKYLSALPTYPANPEGAKLVETIRTDMISLMHAHGAAHFQYGKLYPYLDGRDAGALALLHAIKQHMDPKGILNPGALGLQ